MQPRVFPAMYWFITFIAMIFLCGSTLVFANDDDGYVNCDNLFDCGDIKGVGYPFSGSNRPAYCGHPELKLDCNDQDPEITIKKLTYKVLGINYQSRNLSVARKDYAENNICPTLLLNTTWIPNLLNYTSDDHNITIYYGCSTQGAPALANSSQFTCTEMTGYFTTVSNLSEFGSSASNLISYLASCKDRIEVPVRRSALANIFSTPTVTQLLEGLNEGFDFVWSANDTSCEECKSSGGKCGYNQTTAAFSCYCKDQPRESSCPQSPTEAPSPTAAPPTRKKRNLPLVIGLSTGSAVVIGLFIGCWVFYVIQRKKRKFAAQVKSKGLPVATPPSSKGPASSINLSQTSSFLTSSKSSLEKGSTYFGVRVFSYNELEEATNSFDPSKELGDGGFGTVYHGVLKDGRVVAVKRLFENNMRRAEQFMNEIEILAHIRHKNLVILHGCTSRHSRELLLVYEYIPNGTVADHLHGRQSTSGVLTWPVRLSIAIETASALAHLHANEVIHRDVKTNNILLDNDFRVKVADFGLSRLFPTDVTHVSTAPQGTPGYVDPEYYQCYQLTSKSDVYSFGVVLIELISSLQAVDTNRHRHDINLSNMAVNKIQNHALNELVDPLLGFDKNPEVRRMVTSVAELAFRCLQQDREMRPSMEEVLEALKRVEKENYDAGNAEVLDIRDDDVGLLKHAPPPAQLSPDSLPDQFWASSSSTITPNSY